MSWLHRKLNVMESMPTIYLVCNSIENLFNGGTKKLREERQKLVDQFIYEELDGEYVGLTCGRELIKQDYNNYISTEELISKLIDAKRLKPSNKRQLYHAKKDWMKLSDKQIEILEELKRKNLSLNRLLLRDF